MSELQLSQTAVPHVLMNHWQNMRTFSLDENVDVVVIGTGAGGAPLLARLAGAGLKVIAFEAGPRFDPYKDFATDEKSQGQIFWTHERISSGKDAMSFGRNNSGTGVGGSTLHYTAYTPRAHRDDIFDWPINFSDLERYYEEVEDLLGVSGPEEYPWGSRKKPYPMKALPLNQAGFVMLKACNEMGIKASPAPNAALSGIYYKEGIGWRPACGNRGFCQSGCNLGAKASMDVTYIPLAVNRGAEVRDECFVTGFEFDLSRKKITGVNYLYQGKSYVQKCQAVFLAAGGIETPRLLLLNNVGNSSNQVGRNFMAHPGSQVWGTFKENMRPYFGIPGAAISEDFHRAPKGEYQGGYLIQSLGITPVTYASQLVRWRKLRGEKLKQHMKNYMHMAGINMMGECFPSEGNFMELSSEIDDLGLAKPLVHFSYGPNELKMMEHAENLMVKIWKKAGAEDIWVHRRSAHLIGTCRMGKDPRNSVVDETGKCHDMDNLYISDNSIFPSSLTVNPALTIMALSLKIADQFLQKIR